MIFKYFDKFLNQIMELKFRIKSKFVSNINSIFRGFKIFTHYLYWYILAHAPKGRNVLTIWNYSLRFFNFNLVLRALKCFGNYNGSDTPVGRKPSIEWVNRIMKINKKEVDFYERSEGNNPINIIHILWKDKRLCRRRLKLF